MNQGHRCSPYLHLTLECTVFSVEHLSILSTRSVCSTNNGVFLSNRSVCDDDWGREVKDTVNDLQAADTIYHQSCSVNFRTKRQIPAPLSPQIVMR